MSVLYFDLNNGVAGDMLTAALLSLFENKEEIVEELNAFHIPHTEYKLEKTTSHGISGYHMNVLIHGEEEDHHDHHHHHGHHLYEVKDIVSKFNVKEIVKQDIYNVYDLLAKAESTVHGTTVDEIHFHEVGNLDAIADISAVCYLVRKLNPEKIISSKICVGSGTVKCAHGILPVPAPACMELLKGIPFYLSEKVESELATPTGIALVKYLTDEYKLLDNLDIEKIGIGIGTKDFGLFTGIRVMFGKKFNL